MSDVEIRQLRYFIAVAEERNFTRAAERLLMTQPALSRAIRALEREVGAELLVRSPGDVGLTPAGRVLLAEARTLVAQAGNALARARRTGGGPSALTVTASGCNAPLMDDLVRSFNDGDPAVPAEAVVGNAADQLDRLRSGAADLALLRAAPDPATMDGVPLLLDQVHVMLSASHRLAGRSSLTTADLADEPVLRWQGGNLQMMTPELWPEGFPGRPGPDVSDGMQLFAVVRLGQAVVLCPPPAQGFDEQPGTVTLPLADKEPVPLRLVWLREHARLPAVRAFVRHSRARVAAQPVVSG
ncbi:LysR family transcriptional regulator [Nonomuraea sp. NPDC049421]|uniref:LysR family transcriptional regulator n=1 Tax=Nonomuraea sp. NPDC049421 TaxID=3155275 RepID=UPI003414AC8D